MRPFDWLFRAWVVLSLIWCAAAFVAQHVFGWRSSLAGGIDYWFYFSVLFGPILFLTRRPMGRFLLALPGSRTLKMLATLALLCSLEEWTCYLAGTGAWDRHPRPPLFPLWFFGTAVIMAWAVLTFVMTRLLKLDRKEALYIGGLAGWFLESFIFVPRFLAAPVLLTALGPLIAFTYMQLIIWPLEMYGDSDKKPAPKRRWLRYLGALAGILILETATATVLFLLIITHP